MIGLAFGLALAAAGPSAARPSSAGRTYYVDCARGDDASAGDAESAPWKSLAKASSVVLTPGDSLLLRRGTACSGTLWPMGSGRSAAPIVAGAYGAGPRPRIEAGRAEEAFKLFNQEYWDVKSLELSGGTTYGILVSGDRGVLHHIHLQDLSIHDVVGSMSRHESGLVVLTPGTTAQRFDDVLVDGVEAYNTSQWAGILVGGGDFGYPPESTWSTRVVVRNSQVHDVMGDGIVLLRVIDGGLETNVAWHTGMQATQTMGTPNAIWTWMCHGCTVRGNEAFLTDSPGVDGGAFDIDYGDIDNVVADNYGHDTQGYCAAVFAASWVTKNSVLRGNVCARNGLSPRLAQAQGALYVHTWNGGSIDGLAIGGNTIDWARPGPMLVMLDDSRAKAPKIAFRGNALISDAPLLLSNATDALELGDNRYIDKSAETSEAVKLEAAAASAPPRLKDMDGRPIDPASGTWTLYSFLRLDSDGVLDAASRSQIIVLKSLLEQFRSRGLRLILAFPGDRDVPLAAAARRVAFKNALYDWGVPSAVLAASEKAGDAPRTLLVSPEGKLVKTWPGFSGPATLGYEARRWLGEPAYARLPMMPAR